MLRSRRTARRGPTVPLPGTPVDAWVVPPADRVLATSGAPAPVTAPATEASAPAVEAPPAAEDQAAHTPEFCGHCGFHSHPGERCCEECGEPLVH